MSRRIFPTSVRHSLTRATIYFLALCLSPLSWGHETRPAYLQLTIEDQNIYKVLWKRPLRENSSIHLSPVISGQLLTSPPNRIHTTPGYEIQLWESVFAGEHGLDGKTVRIEGLDNSLTDVFLSIELEGGGELHHILRPGASTITVNLDPPVLSIPAYLQQGIIHILEGVDHLCFVACLMLLIRRFGGLVATISAFTVGHSVTLSAAALGYIVVETAFIESLVALSIVIVAIEAVHYQQGKAGISSRHPWLIALSFGLLHGVAFASALSSIGLPQDNLLSALLLFNIGVEIGQIIFVVFVLSLWKLASSWPLLNLQAIRLLAPYSIGSFSVAWCLERLSAY